MRTNRAEEHQLGRQWRGQVHLDTRSNQFLAPGDVVAAAAKRVQHAACAFPGKIVTEVTRLNRFFPAERFHQDYLQLHPDQPYIVFNDLPKIRDLKRTYPDYYLEAQVSFDSR